MTSASAKHQTTRSAAWVKGGSGMVYKAIMNDVDEVAVKAVKQNRPSAREVKQFDQ